MCLIQAYNAIFQSSTVSVGEINLSLDGTTSGNFTIHNPSADAVDYTLDHTPANGMAYFPEGSTRPNQTGYTDYIYHHLTPLSFSASLSLKVEGSDASQDSSSAVTTTIGAGESQTVFFDIRAPEGLALKDVPVASGFIGISSSRNESLSIPYIGPAYDYTGDDAVPFGMRPLTDADRADAWAPTRDIFAAPEVYVGTDRHDMGDYRAFTLNGSDVPVTYMTTTQAAQWNRVDIVRASTNFTPTYYGYDPSKQLPGNLTEPDIADNGTFGGVSLIGVLFAESGTMPVALVNGVWDFPPQSIDPPGYSLPLKKGSYRLIMRCLRFGRDENDASAWDSWMSGVIDVSRDVTFG
ncbi:hypothetical protein SLS62_000625 [Diatrype stigma]|uniref:C5a peptidase/Subtilisin-like protease SBT2-like Fn3-like domain-containing protein n=1 Tax=Diatrype stigma TaxID=117547 RepID=A0AAN9YXN4_9PEZI